MNRAPCACCDGTGRVEAGDGSIRPCSRCRNEEFGRWAGARRPKAPPASVYPFPPEHPEPKDRA